MDPLCSPYLTTVCDTPTASSMFNANVHRLEPLSSSSIDEQCHLVQYPLAFLSPVLAEQTLVGAEILLAQLSQYPLSETLQSDVAQLSQYPLSDSSSLRAGEMSSLPQFNFGDSTNNDVGTALHHEADDDDAATVVVQSIDTESAVKECDIERSDREWMRWRQSSLSPSAGKNVTAAELRDGHVTSDSADAGANSCSNQPTDQQHKCSDDDADLLVSAGTSKRSFISHLLSPANGTAHVNRIVDSSEKMMESDGKCLALGTNPLSASHMKSNPVGSLIDKTDAGLDVPVTTSSQPDRIQCDNLAGSGTVEILDRVTDLQAMSLSAIAPSLHPAGYIVQSNDNDRLPDLRWASSSSSAFVEQAGSSLPAEFNELCKAFKVAAAVGGDSGTDLETLFGQSVAIMSDDAMRKLVEIPTDEQMDNHVKPPPLDDDANSLRNAADGSEVSDSLSYAVSASANISHIVPPQSSGPASHGAYHDVVSGSDGRVSTGHSEITEQSRTVTHGFHSSMSDRQHQHNSITGDNELLSAEPCPQKLPTLSQDRLDADRLVLPLEPDSGSEFDFDEDHLGDDVKMILAKYRVRRGPVGSDSMPTASTAKTDEVPMSAADDSLLLDGQKITKNDFDTGSSSDSSDDTLAVRVKALLTREQQQSSSKILPALTTSSEMPQSIAKVPSMCSSSSHSTAVDYNSLSREPFAIQMNLKVIQSGESSSSGSQRSSYIPPTDMSLTQEPGKSSFDQLLQQGFVVGSNGDSLHANYNRFVLEASAATSGLKHIEANMWRSQSGLWREVPLMSVSSVGRGAKPSATMTAELDRDLGRSSTLLVHLDLPQTGTDAKSAHRPMPPSMTSRISLRSASDTKFADNSTSLPGLLLPKSVHSLVSRSGGMITAGEDTMSSTGSVSLGAKLDDDGQSANVSVSSRAVLDTVTEASSLQTDIHQSDSTNYAQSDDLRSVHGQRTTVEAAVRELEQSLSNLIQTHGNGTAPASNSYSYPYEEKQSSVEAALANLQLPALSDDECRPSERGLSESFTDSNCGLSPVPNRDPFNIMRSIQPLPSTQHESTIAPQSDHNIVQWSSSRYYDRDVQQTEALDPQSTEHQKWNEYKTATPSISHRDTAGLSHAVKSHSVGSSDQSLISDTHFVSSTHLEFTPLVELPPGCDSSESGSYNGDGEQVLTDRQSCTRDDESTSSNAEAGELQSVSAGRSLGGHDVSAVKLHTLNAAHTSVSRSLSDLHLLQPYQ